MEAMKGGSRASGVLWILLGLALVQPAQSNGQAPDPVVHAILFYSPSCAHCHALINDHLIPLQEEYGSRFVILAFDVKARALQFNTSRLVPSLEEATHSHRFGSNESLSVHVTPPSSEV